MVKEKELKVPFIVRRKLQDTGSSFTISIPKEWFARHNLDTKKIKDLLLVGNTHILILNPIKSKIFERDIHKLIENYVKGKIKGTGIEKAVLSLRSKNRSKKGA